MKSTGHPERMSKRGGEVLREPTATLQQLIAHALWDASWRQHD